MKYYIIAGEASGDLHGSNLMKGLIEADSNACFRFWGGDLMAAQGGVLVKHYKETAVMGFVEVLRSLGKITSNLKHCKRDISEFNPDILILIDYPGFNFRIARFAKKMGLTVFYYISPKVWAWKESRVKYLKRDVDKLFIIFPFEIEYFKNKGIEAIYRGNPLLDSVAPALASKESEKKFIKRNNLSSKPIIALLAGSRVMEIDYLMPVMVQLESRFPDYQFVLAGAPSVPALVYDKYIKGTGIILLFNETYNILKHCKAAVVASGTASLEAALFNAPQVVCYGGNELSYQIAKRLVKVKYISLVNLILNQPLVKELIQHDYKTGNVENELKRVLSPKNREKILNRYQKIRKILGGEGASLKIARQMIEEYKTIIESKRFYGEIDTPIGTLLLICDNYSLISVTHVKEQRVSNGRRKSKEEGDTHPVLDLARQQFKEYFLNERQRFDIPVRLDGTGFQIKVWQELQKIPFGKVKSYGEVAELIGTPEATRAVGLACKMNPLLIVVPCHRVVGAHNRLTGFNIGLEKKGFLLEHEKAYLSDDKTLFT